MSRVIDFDAFRSEQKLEPLELKLAGKTYELPPSLPATLALDLMRLHEEDGDEMEIPAGKIREFGEAIFGGADRFRLILDAGGVTLEEMPELLKQIVTMYQGATPGDRPNRAARRARAAAK